MRKSLKSINDSLWKELAINFQLNVIIHREDKGWTQSFLAKKAKLNVATVADIEQGMSHNPRIETIAALTKTFGIKDPLALLKAPAKAKIVRVRKIKAAAGLPIKF